MPPFDVANIKSYLSHFGVDVNVDVLFLRYAVNIGGDNYQQLQNSTVGDAIFSALLFPENRERVINAFRSELDERGLNFDGIESQTKRFCERYVAELFEETPNATIIYFHLYTKTLYSSLYIASLIKDRYNIPIWFGGYHCQGDCGQSLKAIFPFIDKIFERDVERSIALEMGLIKSFSSLENTSGDLNDFQPPDYTAFCDEVQQLSADFRKSHLSHFWLQVEFNRGCWWNQCSFCTLNCQFSSFQEKSIENIIRDYRYLQTKYQTAQIMVYERNSGKAWKKIISSLDEVYPGLKGTYELSFKVSELQNEDDIKFLKEHDISILVGVESLSKNELEKLQKGQTVIQTIQMLKYMEKHSVKCFYNLMCLLPFETEEDVNETERIISFIIHLIPPFDLEIFRLTYGSLIQQNPKKYDIKRLSIRKNIEGVLFPQNVQENYIPFFLDFESVHEGMNDRLARWRQMLERWNYIYYGFARAGRPKQHSLLYAREYLGGIEFYDSRSGKQCVVYHFSELERKVYRFCETVKELREIEDNFGSISREKIILILENFVELKLMFKEDAKYISLAI